MRTTSRLITTLALLVFFAGCGGSRSDASITTDIQSKLFSTPETKTSSLDVKTNGGVVTLSGTVPSDGARYEAYKIASETQGVTKVNDQISVGGTQAAEQPAPTVSEPAPAPKPSRSPAPARQQQRQTASSSRPSSARELPKPEPAATPAPEPTPAPSASANAPTPPPFVAPTAPAPAAPVTRTVEIPAGTVVRVQTVDGIDSATSKAGDMFRATLATPIVVRNDVAVPQGTDLYLRLVDASQAGRFKGRSGLTLELASLEYQGQTYQLSSTEYQQTGASEGKRTAATIGAGGAIGAIIGGIVGGGKGAAIGAGAGAGAGTVGAAATKAQQVQIAPESKIDFTLNNGVTVTYNPDRNRSTR